MLLTYAKSVRRIFAALCANVLSFLGRNPYGLSLTEVLFIFLISNFALVFLVFAYVVDTPGATLDIETATAILRNNFRPSEVLVYLLAILAPALWMMAYNWRARRHVGFYWVLLLIQALIVIGSAYIYGKANSGGIQNEEFAHRWAMVCLTIGIAIWYVTLVYKRIVLDGLVGGVDDRVHEQSQSGLMGKLRDKGIT